MGAKPLQTKDLQQAKNKGETARKRPGPVPKPPDQVRSVTVQTMLTQAQVDAIDEHAGDRGRSGWIRQAVEWALSTVDR